MLTKSELTEKKSKSEQLDLVEVVSAEDKIAKKRRYLIIAIVATIGLSFAFWLFRESKVFFQHPESLIPKINLSLPSEVGLAPKASLADNLESELNRILASDVNKWSVTVGTGQETYNWSKNKSSFSHSQVTDIIDKLIDQKASTSKISSYLPQGVLVKEQFSQDATSFSLHSLIIVPNHQIAILLKYNGDVSSFPPQPLPQLVTAIYWTVVQSFTD